MSSTTADVVTETGWAKVNLALHVVGRREDGYHLLETLAVFPEVGDEIRLEQSSSPSFEIIGPMAAPLRDAAPSDNLVMRALATFEAEFGPGPQLAVQLVKRLPVTSGIGGGSADAAAMLRALARLRSVAPLSPRLTQVAGGLGADVPMCLHSTPLTAHGIGEVIADSRRGLRPAMLLANPGLTVSTPQVFSVLTQKLNPALPPLPAKFVDLAGLVDYLGNHSRNDLQPPAIVLAPQIGEVLAAIDALPRVAFARMSGSGATCFGLFETLALAESAASILRRQHPHWWIAAASFDL
jgi:4-diphosphocytidyl-2-C-methyl-D-erythritol kinase